MPEMVTHMGGCHCGAVRFKVQAPAAINATYCNCSICKKSGYLHLSVPREAFTLLQGKDNLTTYTFNKGIAQHYFCKTCGIYPFHQPRAAPTEYTVNVACLDDVDMSKLKINEFDGEAFSLETE